MLCTQGLLPLAIGQSALRSAVDLRSPERATVRKKFESGAVLPWGSSMSA